MDPLTDDLLTDSLRWPLVLCAWQAATVRHVLDQAVRVVAEEKYVEQTADCIVDEFVTTYMVEVRRQSSGPTCERDTADSKL